MARNARWWSLRRTSRAKGWDSHVVALEGQGASEIVRQARERGVSAQAFVPHGRLGLRAMVWRLRAVASKSGRGDSLARLQARHPARTLACRRGFACLATCHNWISETTKMSLLEAVDKRALRRFDHVVAVSDGIATELIGSGVPRESVTVIDNGISVVPVDRARAARCAQNSRCRTGAAAIARWTPGALEARRPPAAGHGAAAGGEQRVPAPCR